MWRLTVQWHRREQNLRPAAGSHPTAASSQLKHNNKMSINYSNQFAKKKINRSINLHSTVYPSINLSAQEYPAMSNVTSWLLLKSWSQAPRSHQVSFFFLFDSATVFSFFYFISWHFFSLQYYISKNSLNWNSLCGTLVSVSYYFAFWKWIRFYSR